MKFLKIILLFSVLLGSSFSSWSQTDEEIAEARARQIFTSKDKDFLQLWYHEQIQEMDLDEDRRDDYIALLTYYTYKMGRITLPQYDYTEDEQKVEFDYLNKKLDAEMLMFLSPENYKIHYKSFSVIVDKVYKQKGWE